MIAVRKSLSLMAALVLATSVAGCSSPPLQLYTLAGAGTGQNGAVTPSTPILEVRRVQMPDYLDTQDILTRNGTALARSPNGRWAERLSDGVTDVLAARIGVSRPDLFVTEQAPLGTTANRLLVTITRLDISSSGTATLEAHWTVIPADEKQSEQTYRVSFSSTGNASSDAGTVALVNAMSQQLATRITNSLPATLLAGTSPS